MNMITGMKDVTKLLIQCVKWMLLHTYNLLVYILLNVIYSIVCVLCCVLLNVSNNKSSNYKIHPHACAERVT